MITVKDSNEFKRLLQALAKDIVDAHISYQLYKDLLAALHEHHLVAIQSNTFLSLTLEAHLNACLHVLCRIYDQNVNALHLRSLLLTISQNSHCFDENEFRERLKDNPYVNSLAQSPRKPDPTILEEDIRSCFFEDPLVKILMIHRGNRIAHINANNIAIKNI